MSDSSNIWNKKMSDLTVGDSAKVSAIAPIITVVVTMALAAAASSLKKGFDSFRANRKNTTNIQPTES